MFRFFLSFMLVLFFVACQSEKIGMGQGVEYASLLNIEKLDGYTRVDVKDAWNDGRILRTYILVPRDSRLPASLPSGTLLRTPLKRVVAFSGIHATLLSDLDCLDAVAAVCDTAYIVSPSLRAALHSGKIADAGNSAHPDVERLLMLKSEALLVSPMEGAAYENLEKAGIPLVMCTDYMETSPLGRAEWMKFLGLLFGREDEADSLFNTVVLSYDSVKTVAGEAEKRPSLMCDLRQGAAWYVPGGNSYLGCLYADAGADYLFADYEENGSVSLTFEGVLQRAAQADLWFVKYAATTPLTYEGIASDYSPYTRFAPWKNRRIYGCNTLNTPFYEEVPFHPDRLLRDVVSICHPDLLPGHRLRYFHSLQ